jgi:Tfp pilus assembly protein PilN
MINLLPLKEKIKRKQEKRLKLIWIWAILLVASLIGLALVLLAINFYISNQIDIQQELIQLEEQRMSQLKELENKIIAVNNSLVYFNNFYTTHFSAVALLEKVSQVLPDGIYLESFFWQEEDMRINLVGYSFNSEQIYQFRERIKQEEGFSRASFNIPDWSEEQKVQFQAMFFLE